MIYIKEVVFIVTIIGELFLLVVADVTDWLRFTFYCYNSLSTSDIFWELNWIEYQLSSLLPPLSMQCLEWFSSDLAV